MLFFSRRFRAQFSQRNPSKIPTWDFNAVEAEDLEPNFVKESHLKSLQYLQLFKVEKNPWPPKQQRISKTGWWYTYPSEKCEFVSWDDDIPNWMESHNPFMFQTTNQL